MRILKKAGSDINTKKLFALAQLVGIRCHQILALAEEMKEFGEHHWMPSVAKKMIRIKPTAI